MHHFNFPSLEIQITIRLLTSASHVPRVMRKTRKARLDGVACAIAFRAWMGWQRQLVASSFRKELFRGDAHAKANMLCILLCLILHLATLVLAEALV